MPFRLRGRARIVEIVQKSGQTPEFLIFAPMPGERAHNGFRGQGMMQQRFRGVLVGQQFQGLNSMDHDILPLTV